MKFVDIKYIAQKFNDPKSNGRVLNFTRKAAFMSIFVGSFALITALSILDGFETLLTETTKQFTSDISISHISDKYISKSNVRLSNIDNIKSYSPTIQKPVIMRTKNDIDGFIAKGIDSEKDINDLKSNIVEGTHQFSSNNAKEIIISKAVSNKFDINLGDKIFLYSIEGHNQEIPKTSILSFNVIGIYETGLGEYDKSFLFIPIKKASDFFDIPDGMYSSIEIDVKYDDKIKETTVELAEASDYNLQVKNVFDFQRSALTWIEVQKEPVPLVLGVITIVAVLNIVTMLLILIVEKSKQIGILKTLGATNSDIIKVFLFIGTKITFLGAFLGAFTAFTFALLQKEFQLIGINSDVYFLNTIPIDINISHYILVIGVSYLLSLIVTILPAFTTSKIQPVKTLRFK